MKNIRIIIILALMLPAVLHAQYVNTDMLMVVPGLEEPVHVDYLDSIYHNHPDSELHNELFFSFNKPLTTGIMLSRFTIPSRGEVISRFGPRSGRMHSGTDIKLNKGDTIYAVFHGTVTRSSYYYGYGNMVVIDHGNNITTSYAHLSAFLVRQGEIVKQGEPLGLAGSTGRATTSHLHFEIRENNRAFNPELVFDFEHEKIKDEVYDISHLAELQPVDPSSGHKAKQSVPQSHTVRSGDSLWTISRRYKTTIQQLCRLNNLTESSVLRIGSIIKLY
jgi:murein DD-endopeptidase MepM/ murein hydrolase activator NlpD